MSEEDYTEVTDVAEVGFMERVMASFKGILTGLALLIAATILLYWNEGRTVRTGDTIQEAKMATVSMASIDTIDASLNGKMVYATGKAVTKDILTDPLTDVSVNAIALKRTVSYYQWVENVKKETKKAEDGTKQEIKTYTYEQKWTNSPISSAEFKRIEGHENTVIKQVEPKEWDASEVKFGAYLLPTFMVNSINTEKDVPVKVSLASLENKLFPANANVQIAPVNAQVVPVNTQIAPANAQAVPANTQSVAANVPMGQAVGPKVHLEGDVIYLGLNPVQPSIGDIKISYKEVPQVDISILARVNNNTFDKFLSSNGNSFYDVEVGSVGQDIMYQDAADSNTTMAWILRVVGTILAIAGLKLILGPIAAVASFVPFLGEILGAGVALVSSVCGVVWSLIIIALAWIRFRPVLGISLLVISLALVVGLYIKGRSQKKEA